MIYTASGAASPITVPDLPPGFYTFTVTARNELGSATSVVSSQVRVTSQVTVTQPTPTPPLPTYDAARFDSAVVYG